MRPLPFPVTHLPYDAQLVISMLGLGEPLLLAPPAAGGETAEGDLAPRLDREVEERLRGLLRELKGWASALGLGRGVSAVQVLDMMRQWEGESVQAIIEVLRRRDRRDHLLTAMLLLTLSHRADREEAVLEEEVRRLSQEQGRLREIIQGSSPAQEPLERLTPLLPLRALERRLRAWTLALTLCPPAPETALPLGLTIDLKDRLEQEGERLEEGFEAVEAARLALPWDLARRMEGMGGLWEEVRGLLAAPRWGAELARAAEEWNRRVAPAPGVIHLAAVEYPMGLHQLLAPFLPQGWESELPPLPPRVLYLL